MTREEWINDIEDLGDLRTWCIDNGVFEDTMYDIYDDYEVDDEINDDVANCGDSWSCLRDYLNDIPTGYNWYRRDGSFDYVGLVRGDFLNLKQEVLDYLDNYGGFFDDEEEEEESASFDAPGPDAEEVEAEPDLEAPEFNAEILCQIGEININVIVNSRPPEPEEAPESEPVAEQGFDAPDELCDLIPLF